MRRAFIFPTIEQAKNFILSEPRDPVFVAGAGMANMAAATVRAIKAKKPHLIVLCGLADSFDGEPLSVGDVVEVVTEQEMGGEGILHTSSPDIGLPMAAGITISHAYCNQITHQEAIAEQLAESPLDDEQPERLPLLIDGEGSTFMALCEALEVECCHIRAIAGVVGSSRNEVDVELALNNLTEVLTQIFPKPIKSE